MKFKTNFEDLKNAIITIGKAVKRTPSVLPPVVKFTAIDDYVILSTVGSVGVKVKIPATNVENGSFVTSFVDANVISVRKCLGTVTAKVAENIMSLKYKENRANTNLTAIDGVDVEFPIKLDDTPNVTLQIATLKEMFKDVSISFDDNLNSEMHSVKLDILDDVDGLLKLSMSACDGKSLAIRTAYAVKTGDYTGSVVLLPEQIKTALNILSDDEDVKILFTQNHMFMEQEGCKVFFPVSTKSFPNIKGVLDTKACTFSAACDKAELVEALSCAMYLQNEHKVQTGKESSVLIGFGEEEISVGITGITSYSEAISAEIKGDSPEAVLFNTGLLKAVVSTYPNERVVIGGSTEKQPFWLCCGEHDEYIYCVMPRNKK